MKRLSFVLFVCLFLLSPFSNAQGWQYINSGFNYILYDMSFPSGQSEIGYAVGSTVTYNGNGIILKTTNGGFTWNQISTGTIPGLEAVVFTSLTVGYAGGWQNYFIKTTDGGSTWNQITIDPNIYYIKDIEFIDANHGIVTGYPADLFVTTDGGSTWTPGTGLNQSIEDICYASSNIVFAVGGDEKISKSTNGGLTWNQVYSGIFTRVFAGVKFYNSNFGMVGGEDGKVMVTTNGGNNWSVKDAGGFALWRDFYFSDLNNAIVVGTPEQIYKTTDGGLTWQDDYPASTYNYALYKIKFLENNTGIICGSQGTILRNTDYILPVELTSFTAAKNNENVILSWSTETELNNSGFEIERKTNSDSWQKIGFTPGSGSTTEKKSYSFIDYSVSSGAYSYRLKQIDFNGEFRYSNEINVDVNNIFSYNLEQNFPNPFNPSTKIRFTLPEASLVKLIVLNTIGEKVSDIVNEIVEAGSHEVVFNASNLSTGIYFVRMEAGSFVTTKKITLLK